MGLKHEKRHAGRESFLPYLVRLHNKKQVLFVSDAMLICSSQNPMRTLEAHFSAINAIDALHPYVSGMFHIIKASPSSTHLCRRLDSGHFSPTTCAPHLRPRRPDCLRYPLTPPRYRTSYT